MPPKTRQFKQTEKASQEADIAAATVGGDAVDPPPAALPGRPRASFLPAYLFAASFVIRSILMPMYNSLTITGVVGRASYPSVYTAPGVTCALEALDGPKFCEHEILFEDEGIALLSCDPGRGEWNTVMGPLRDPKPNGKLWLYDYANTRTSKELEIVGLPVGSDFHPLGIGHFSDALKTSLFVINHQRTGPSIEIFSLSLKNGMQTKAVVHEKTVAANPDIKAANGLIALDHEHLYITNDHAWTRLEQGDTWPLVENYLGAIYGQGWITHLDLSKSSPVFTRAFKGIPFPNGIAKGSDDLIYVVSSTGGRVAVLRPLNETTPILGKGDEYVFGYALDNVNILKDPKTSLDTILVGGHPCVPALGKLSATPYSDNVSPSWISVARARTAAELEEKPKAQKFTDRHEPTFHRDWEAKTIYQDDGHHFRSSTGAGIDMDRDILISTGLYQNGLLVCRGVVQAL